MTNDDLLKRLPDAVNASTSKEFTQVPNQLLRNPGITGKAKALLCLLLSNRDGWTSYIQTIKKMMKEGEDAIRVGLRELEQANYLQRIRYRHKKGKKLAGSFWAYTDIPGFFQIDDTLAELDRRGLEPFMKDSKTRESPDMENPIGENVNEVFPDIKRLKGNNTTDKNILNSLRNEFKKAKPSPTSIPSGGRLHRRKNQDDPYLNGILSKSEKPSYKQKALKENRTIPTLLDSTNEDVKGIVRLWNSFGKPLTCHKSDSKVMDRAVERIQKHLTSHSVEDVKCAVRQYFKLVSSSDTSIRPGIPGHVVGLDEFFSFSKHTRDRMAKQKVQLKIKNWFDECLPDKDPVAKYVSEAHNIPDSHPQVTGKFKRLFVKKVLGGIVGQFTPREENCFKRASMKMVTFLKVNGNNLLLDPDERRNPLLFVNYIFDAIESQTNGNFSRVTPGWFSNDGLYTKTLPAYLHDQAMVRDSEF